GLGAYTSTILQVNYDISPWIGMVAGGVVAVLASLPIGWLCFRLRGPYFTIATIATAQALMLIFLKFRDFAWGAEGTTIPNLGSSPLMMQFEAKASYYYVVLGLLVLGLAITLRIERSWMGYYLVAIGEDEDAAEAIGVNAPRIKRDIYMISAYLTTLAGTFYVQYIYFIDPATAFSFNISIEAALVSIVGGIGTLWGPLIGTVLLETTSALLQSWLGSPNGGGKTTSFHLISGFHRADAGSVQAFGRELVGLRPHDVCAFGLARTFQVAKPFGAMSVLDNVMTGAFLRDRHVSAARDKAEA